MNTGDEKRSNGKYMQSKTRDAAAQVRKNDNWDGWVRLTGFAVNYVTHATVSVSIRKLLLNYCNYDSSYD